MKFTDLTPGVVALRFEVMRTGKSPSAARRGYWRNGFERDARGQNRMRATEQPAP